MRQDFFTYTPIFKLLIVGNHRPVLRNVDDAARRRFNIIPFTHKPAEPDLSLPEKLKAEWPAILRWAIDGCLDWQGNGLVRPAIDGSIGEGSPFHHTFGYCAHGVREDTAVLPANWKSRLVPLRHEDTGGATAFCIEIHDLAVSKLMAGREKDLQFVAGLLRLEMVEPDLFRHRLNETPIDEDLRALCEARLLRFSTQA